MDGKIQLDLILIQVQLEDDFLEFLHDTEVVMQVHVAIGSDCQTIAATPVKFCEILSYPTNKVSLYRQNNLESMFPHSCMGRSFSPEFVEAQRRAAPSAASTTGSSCTPTTPSGFSGGWRGGGHARRWPGRGGKRGNKNCGV